MPCCRILQEGRDCSSRSLGDLSGPYQGYAPTEDGGEHHYENVAKAGKGHQADDGAYTMMAAVSTTAC